MIKNGRAPGADDISLQLLRLGEKIVPWLVHLVWIILENEKVLQDWVKKLTIPLHKKGTFHDCDNFRGVVLINVSGNVFYMVFEKRVVEIAEEMLRESECALHRCRGCVNQIITYSGS